MKKIITIILTFVFCVGCNYSTSSKQEDTKTLLIKDNISSSMADSPINTRNLDEYLFIEGVNYVDVRPYEWIINDGYVAGFRFIPFYELIAKNASAANFDNILFSYNYSKTPDGQEIRGGDVGSFSPIYQESIQIIKQLFPSDEPILFISQSGVESGYIINLLIQLGYDGKNLYNIGGFSNSDGIYSAYKKLVNPNPKYFIQGNPYIDIEIDLSLSEELTKIP